MVTCQARDELARLLNALPAQFAITLKYASGPLTMDKVSNDLKALRARVDRQALGRHYHKSPDRARYWAIAEMLDVLPHVHTAWAFKTRAHGIALLRLLRNGVWETVAKGGSHDAQIYDPSAYLLDHGWAGYAVKRLTTLDDLIISYEP